MEPNIPNIEILLSCDFNLGVLYTRSLYLWVWGSALKKGFWGWSPRENVLGCVLANSIVDPWYWVNPRVFPLYFPYKRKHCKTIEYGMVLHCIGRETVRALLTPLC